MKLGTQTASLVNHIQSRATIGQPTPTVGMGATILCWTDRHPATIIEIWEEDNTYVVAVQEDHASRTDKNGLSEVQEYDYSPNCTGSVSYYRLVDGRWQGVRMNSKTKRWNKAEGSGLRIGEREKYHDFSF